MPVNTGTVTFSRDTCHSIILKVLNRTNSVSFGTKARSAKTRFGCISVVDRRDSSIVYEECVGVCTPGIMPMLVSKAHERLRGLLFGNSESYKGAIYTKDYLLVRVGSEDAAIDELVAVAVASRLKLFTLEEADAWLKLHQNPFVPPLGTYPIPKVHYLALLGYREHLHGQLTFMDEK